MARNRQRAKQRQAERRAERLSRMASDTPVDEEALEEVELYTGAPPEDTGFSDTVVEHPPPAPEFEGDDEDLQEAVDTGDGTPERTRPRHEPHEPRHHRNRLIAFFFVVIMGAYLGLLDAIFSKLIDKIL